MSEAAGSAMPERRWPIASLSPERRAAALLRSRGRAAQADQSPQSAAEAAPRGCRRVWRLRQKCAVHLAGSLWRVLVAWRGPKIARRLVAQILMAHARTAALVQRESDRVKPRPYVRQAALVGADTVRVDLVVERAAWERLRELARGSTLSAVANRAIEADLARTLCGEPAPHPASYLEPDSPN